MRALALLGLLLCAPALAADPPVAEPEPLAGARVYEVLPPGRYAVSITGMLCGVCARAIAAEWAKLPEVDKASADFGKSMAVVEVKLDSELKVTVLRKALKRAEKLANLGASFEIKEIAYRTR